MYPEQSLMDNHVSEPLNIAFYFVLLSISTAGVYLATTTAMYFTAVGL